MRITIFCADTPQFDVAIDSLDNYADLGVAVKVIKAIQDYYDNQEFLRIGDKLGGLYETQKES